MGGHFPDVDEEQFAALYRAHGSEVWRYARRRTDSADDADDATAEAFAIAWRRRADLPPGGDLRLWLLGTIRRVVANHHRSSRRRSSLEDRLRSGAASAGPPDPAGEATADEGLWRGLAALPADQRDLLLLRAWDGLAVSDIAVLLDCSPNAASIRLTRARARLAEELGTKDRPLVRTSKPVDPDRGGRADG